MFNTGKKLLVVKSLILFTALNVSVFCFGQSRWNPYIGLHISGDAELYYIGPSFQLGTDFKIKKAFSATAYVHYFPKKVDRINGDGTFEKGNYKSATAAILLEIQFGKTTNKKTFVGAGAALQKSKDDFISSWNELHNNRTIIIPAIRVGHNFSFLRHNLCAELNGTGPYSYDIKENGFTNNVLEILTQVSLGTRFFF